MDKGLLPSTTEANGLLLALAGGTKEKKGSGGGDFRGLIQSLLSAPDREPDLSRPPGNIAPASGYASLARRNETGRAKPAEPRELWVEATERLGVLADDGAIDLEGVAKLSDEDFADLMAWLLAGAGGLFPPVETTGPLVFPDLSQFGGGGLIEGLSGAEGIGPGASEGLSGRPQEALAGFLQQLLDSSGAAEESLLTGPALVEELAGLDTLSREEFEALAAALEKALRGNLSAAAPENVSTDAAALVEEALGRLDRAAAADLLARAAQEAGGPEALQDAERLAAMPKSLLEKMAVEILDAPAGGDMLRELSLRAGRAILEVVSLPPEENAATAEGDGAPAPESGLLDELVVESNERLPSLPPESKAAGKAKAPLPGHALSGRGKAPEKPEQPDAPKIAPETPESGNLSDEAADPGEFLHSAREEKLHGARFVREAGAALSGATLEDTALPAGAEPQGAPAPVTSQTDPAAGIRDISPAEAHRSAGPASDAMPPPPPPAERYVDAEQNVERLSQALKISVSRRISSATMQLSPPELGKVRMQIVVKDGVVSAHVRTETEDARLALISHLQHLRQSMATQGLKLGDFEISYGSGQSDTGQEQASSGQSSHRQGGSSGSDNPVPETAAETESERETGFGRINAVV